MTPQQNPEAARALRDIGTQAVLDFAGDDWREAAIEICTRFFRLHAATTNPPIGALFEEAKEYAKALDLEDPHSVNAWGAVCLSMSRRGIIVKTGQYANSAGVRSHYRANPLWRLS
jgi:hypothetical protein